MDKYTYIRTVISNLLAKGVEPKEAANIALAEAEKYKDKLN